MPHRRPRRRGDWARRLTANMDPLSSDSDIFPCDSSCSSDSFSSHDNYLPRRTYVSLPDLSSPISPPPPLDIRDVAFAEYAAAELPDLAIFFRNIIPPFASPNPYSHRISSLNTSFSDLSLAISRSPRSPRSPRPSRDLAKSAALPPAFPDSARRPLSARQFNHPPKTFPEAQSPPASPPAKLHRSRSAPIRSSAFSSQSPTPRTPRSVRHKSSKGETSSTPTNNRPRRRSSLRTKSSVPQQSSSRHRQSVLVPSGLSNSTSRPVPKKKNLLSTPRILTTRRCPEDLEMSAQTATVSNRVRAADPDSFNHFFLIEKIHRWYHHVFFLTGERVLRVYKR